MKKNILIIGAGDVGKTLAKALENYYNVFLLDKKIKNDFTNKCFEIIHICYYYDEKFIPSTIEYIDKFKSSLVIINSTVAVGTIDKIILKTGFKAIVHSPIIGDHDNLLLGIKTFTKPIGSSSIYYGQKTSKHFRKAGIKTKLFNDPKITELGKLLLTSQFALNISYHQEMERIAQKGDIKFSKAVNQMKSIFNEGYSKIRPNVILPNLFPGKIQGKCLMQNLKILDEFYQSDFSNLIKKSNNKKE